MVYRFVGNLHQMMIVLLKTLVSLMEIYNHLTMIPCLLCQLCHIYFRFLCVPKS
nr:MAG TPA: hypothetical protein [Caudoviricetes sp.]